jgi:hypothetical protein
MFGGGYDDTWEWDGTNWSERQPSLRPPAFSAPGLAYDAARGTVVMYGGGGVIQDPGVWEWDGTSWTNPPAMIPPRRENIGFAYAAASRRLVVFGGWVSPFHSDETWELAYEDTSRTEETCQVAGLDGDGDGLAGCADPDCWGRCDPLCPPFTTCAANRPRCGDAVCNAFLENNMICPADCPPP